MASSFLYCILALKLWFLFEYREYKPLEHRKMLIWMLLALIAAINLIPVFVVNNVDWTANLGGLVTGGLFGCFLHFQKDEAEQTVNK